MGSRFRLSDAATVMSTLPVTAPALVPAPVASVSRSIDDPASNEAVSVNQRLKSAQLTRNRPRTPERHRFSLDKSGGRRKLSSKKDALWLCTSMGTCAASSSRALHSAIRQQSTVAPSRAPRVIFSGIQPTGIPHATSSLPFPRYSRSRCRIRTDRKPSWCALAMAIPRQGSSEPTFDFPRRIVLFRRRSTRSHRTTSQSQSSRVIPSQI